MNRIRLVPEVIGNAVALAECTALALREAGEFTVCAALLPQCPKLVRLYLCDSRTEIPRELIDAIAQCRTLQELTLLNAPNVGAVLLAIKGKDLVSLDVSWLNRDFPPVAPAAVDVLVDVIANKKLKQLCVACHGINARICAAVSAAACFDELQLTGRDDEALRGPISNVKHVDLYGFRLDGVQLRDVESLALLRCAITSECDFECVTRAIVHGLSAGLSPRFPRVTKLSIAACAVVMDEETCVREKVVELACDDTTFDLDDRWSSLEKLRIESTGHMEAVANRIASGSMPLMKSLTIRRGQTLLSWHEMSRNGRHPFLEMLLNVATSRPLLTELDLSAFGPLPMGERLPSWLRWLVGVSGETSWLHEGGRLFNEPVGRWLTDRLRLMDYVTLTAARSDPRDERLIASLSDFDHSNVLSLRMDWDRVINRTAAERDRAKLLLLMSSLGVRTAVGGWVRMDGDYAMAHRVARFLM